MILEFQVINAADAADVNLWRWSRWIAFGEIISLRSRQNSCEVIFKVQVRSIRLTIYVFATLALVLVRDYMTDGNWYSIGIYFRRFQKSSNNLCSLSVTGGTFLKSVSG